MDRYFSHAETPDGSQPTFVEDEIIPICFITQQPSLAPSSFTRPPISLPYGALTLREDDGLTTFRLCTCTG